MTDEEIEELRRPCLEMLAMLRERIRWGEVMGAFAGGVFSGGPLHPLTPHFAP